jgi:drug/metabolite transporter (DMT)-like permease
MNPLPTKQIYIGIGLAVLATIVWAGNFVIARGMAEKIPPISLAFYRWATASLIMLPLAYKKFKAEKPIVLQNKQYLFWISLSGIALFNTLVYFAGHYSPAINLALIGTTSSPVMSIIMAAIFLKERITLLRIIGLLLCIAGIIYLISQGSWERLKAFHFSEGDVLILLAAFTFAVYNIFVRRKPAGLSAINFLFVIFTAGTLLLLPGFIYEIIAAPAVQWDVNLILIILYLGLGTSVISFLCWNAAISRLGAARTALFGNLIPIFASLEAVFFLGEKISVLHLISGVVVITGLIIANLRKS